MIEHVTRALSPPRNAQDRGPGVPGLFLEHVQHRFQAGCTSLMQLYRELLIVSE
ncbi:hypothetical protein [Streptomyces sp. NPDC096339]|uniref:hypothetical protein n=1 Tax=Streptomyces sp. NPDC096339 TaxID=3366086 RepID=UPI00382B9817